MKFSIFLLSTLSVFALGNAYSFNTLAGADVFPEHLNEIQTKSNDPSDFLSQLKSLVSQPTILSELYDNYKNLYHAHGLRLDSNVTMREQIFAKNLLDISAHNVQFQTGASSYERGINQFADMTEQELESVMGYKVSLEEALKESELPMIDLTLTSLGQGVPDALDWRKKNAVTPIKDQGQCGSCITFSVAGTLESAILKNGGQSLDLSEQELVDCTFPENKGCAGGQFAPALRYITKNGLITEAEYPYKGTSGFFNVCKRNSKPQAAKAQSYGAVTPKGSEDSMKAAVAQYGPLAISVHSNNAMQSYKSGVFKGPCAGQSNHALMVVGYGNDGTDDFWIIKNSWGTKWGEQGYMRLARNKMNLCNVASEAFHVIPVSS